MYFFLRQADYHNLNLYKSFFISEKEPVYVRLNKNELSVFTIKIDIQAQLVEQKRDIFNLNMSRTDDLEQFLLKINDNGFRNNVELNESVKSTNTADFSLIRYGKLFPNNNIFTTNKEQNNYPIEFLFCLIEDIFDNLSEFNRNNPEECIHYRKILQQSKIFEYINKKRLFYKSLFEYQQSWQKNEKNVIFKQELIKNYGQYLNLLLKNEMLAYIPCEIFEKDDWFLRDPEKEIIRLASFNVQYKLDLSTIPQIQDFLLKKHDILNANVVGMKNKKFNLFICQIVSTLIFVFASYSWLDNQEFNTSWLVVIGALFSVLPMFSIFLLAFWKKNINLNLIMLRFALSIISVWVIFFTVDGIFQSFLNVNESSFYPLLVLIPVIIFVATHIEIHIHSPYHLKGDIFKIFLRKTVPIFIYALNLAFISGIFFHMFFISKYVEDNHLIKNNKYVQSKIESIEKKIKGNSELIEILKEIEETYILRNGYILYKDSNFTSYIDKSYNQKLQDYNFKLNQVIKQNASVTIVLYEKLIAINDSTIRGHNVLLKNDSILLNNQTKLLKLRQLFENDSILQDHISNIPKNDRISIEWDNIFIPDKITKSTGENNQFNRKQRVNMWDRGLYYKFFLLQVMLVMTFAIVGQAIISKDTITEPL